MNLEKSTADNEWKDSGVESTAEKLLKNTELNEKSNDDILGSELSSKDKKFRDIETEIVDLKAKIITLEVKREEVEVALKQIEGDMFECTSKTDQQELSAKLSTKETYLNSLTQEIVAKETRINSLTVQMNGIILPSSSDNGK
jgi:predicted  nucleic acid-binding Zn-ribbon protein